MSENQKDFTASERVAIAAAIEEEIGRRQGARTDRLLPQKIAEVKRGSETREFASQKAGFGNRETYRQAKAVVQKGTPELVEAMDKKVVSISAAAKLAKAGDLKSDTVSDFASVAADIGLQTADLATILFALPMRETIKAMFEVEIHDEVAALFGDDPHLDPAECENCQFVAWLAFDRRLALHVRE